MTYSMCALCKENEQKLQEISRAQANQRVEESLSRDNITDVIRYTGDFYNAQTMTFDELRAVATSDEEFATMIQSRIEHLQNTIIPSTRRALEQSNAELYLYQRKLNEVVSQLDAEARKQFASANISIPQSKIKPVKVPSVKSKNPIDALAAQYMQVMNNRGTPIKPLYEAYHNGELLLRTSYKEMADIKAKENGGSVKEISAFDVAKLRVQSQLSDAEFELNE